MLLSITIFASNHNENQTIKIKGFCRYSFPDDALVLSCVVNPGHPFPLERCAFAPPKKPKLTPLPGCGNFSSARTRMTERELLINKKGKTNLAVRQEDVTWCAQQVHMHTHIPTQWTYVGGAGRGVVTQSLTNKLEDSQAHDSLQRMHRPYSDDCVCVTCPSWQCVAGLHARSMLNE